MMDMQCVDNTFEVSISFCDGFNEYLHTDSFPFALI